MAPFVLQSGEFSKPGLVYLAKGTFLAPTMSHNILAILIRVRVNSEIAKIENIERYAQVRSRL